MAPKPRRYTGRSPARKYVPLFAAGVSAAPVEDVMVLSVSFQVLTRTSGSTTHN
jgi:hypothetical protein